MFIVLIDLNFEHIKGTRQWLPLLDDRNNMNQFPSVEWLKGYKKNHQLKDFEWLIIDMNTLNMDVI